MKLSTEFIKKKLCPDTDVFPIYEKMFIKKIIILLKNKHCLLNCA